jgi:hypothetical protein
VEITKSGPVDTRSVKGLSSMLTTLDAGRHSGGVVP